jgi:hypothetical protein
MLYNHANDSNAAWQFTTKSRQAILIATQDIPARSEITINYGIDYWNRKNVIKN